MPLEVQKYYDISFKKNHERSNQLCLERGSFLSTLLLKELESPRAIFGHKLPFWIHGEDVWLEVQQSTNIPSRADCNKVIFVFHEGTNKLECHFKKMEPFALSHYISLEMISNLDATMDELECGGRFLKDKDIPAKVIKKQRANLKAVCLWKNHPSRVGEKKITELLEFYNRLFPLGTK